MNADRLCMAEAELCVCHVGAGHEPPHRCCCGGAWSGTLGEEDFEIFAWPVWSEGSCEHETAEVPS